VSSFSAISFSGSLRAESANTGLICLAAELAPPELRVEISALPAALPFYNPDLEDDLPDVAVEWRALVKGADALVIGLPEYNFGPSALAKNAVDWLTRPFGRHALNGKVVALLTAGGKGGGTRVQESLGTIIGLLGNTVVSEPPVTIAMGATRVNASGSDDGEVRDLVAARMANVLAALRSR
jgi:chromate reductase, NAD(P)H dehydrogenase (quinone)